MRKLTVIRLLVMACLLLALPAMAGNLEDINRRVLKPDYLEAGFTQNKYLKILKTPLVSSGQFWINRQNGIVWQVEKPFYSRVVITGKGVTFSDQQSQKTAKSMEYIGKVLHGILAGDLMKINEQFTVIIKDAGDTSSDWQVEMEPRSALLRKGILKIDMAGNAFIRHLVLHEATGDRTEIVFNQARAIEALPAEVMHVFGKP